VTVAAPRRRLDLALPEHLPLAELLPELLRQAGEGLADEGERHAGWQLRRTDGHVLATVATLAQHGVRDGEVLHLVPADAHWPEPAFDDLVETIAAGARVRGPIWTAASTRSFALLASSALLAVGLVAVLGAGPAWTAPGTASVVAAAGLLIAAVVGARAYGDAAAAAVLGAFAVAYAAAGGLLAMAGGDPLGALGAPHLLVGATAGLFTSVLAAVAIGHALRVFVATGTASVAVAGGALAGFSVGTAAAAAIVLSAAVLLIPVLPVLAIRLGKVPLPVTTRRAPGGLTTELADLPPLPDRDSVFAAVARTDAALTGLIGGCAISAFGAGAVVVATGGPAGRPLVAVAAAVLALRARAFVAVAQRLPLLGTGLVGLALVAAALIAALPSAARLPVGLPIAVAAALASAAAGAVYQRRPPSPYLSRFTDFLDVVLVLAVVPLACAVLDLFGWARGLAG
jgi:type VII secretion integral membrane protein EccD